MNDFAVNGAELNGDPEVWIEDAIPAQVQFAASGLLSKARFLEGEATIQHQASGGAYKQSKPSGSGQVVMASTLPPSVWKYLDGGAQYRINASGILLRQAKASGFAQEIIQADGEARVFGPPRGDAFIRVQCAGEMRVAHSVQLNPRPMIVELKAGIKEDSRKAKMGAGALQFWLHPLCKLNVNLHSAKGDASVSVEGAGSPSVGAKVYLEGEPATILSYATGELGGYHYIYLSGEASISFKATWRPTGYPVQPGQYIPAQDERVMFALRDNRALYVDREVSCCLAQC